MNYSCENVGRKPKIFSVTKFRLFCVFSISQVSFKYTLIIMFTLSWSRLAALTFTYLCFQYNSSLPNIDNYVWTGVFIL